MIVIQCELDSHVHITHTVIMMTAREKRTTRRQMYAPNLKRMQPILKKNNVNTLDLVRQSGVLAKGNPLYDISVKLAPSARCSLIYGSELWKRARSYATTRKRHQIRIRAKRLAPPFRHPPATVTLLWRELDSCLAATARLVCTRRLPCLSLPPFNSLGLLTFGGPLIRGRLPLNQRWISASAGCKQSSSHTHTTYTRTRAHIHSTHSRRNKTNRNDELYYVSCSKLRFCLHSE